MKQAQDFRVVCEQVADLLSGLSDKDFSRETAFKSWSINEILCHLYVWDRAALLSLQDPDAFKKFMQQVAKARFENFREFERQQADGLSGTALFGAWRRFYSKLATGFSDVDPKRRVLWVGPDMSARSSITARFMEVWSHAQAIYDELGVERPDSDALTNVVILGLNTYAWTFKNRGLEPPKPVPQLRLTLASGEVLVLGDEVKDEFVEGMAQEFCQVVTQCRNVADTSLNVSGINAKQWMEMAQCFAGPPQSPPPPGVRGRRNPKA